MFSLLIDRVCIQRLVRVRPLFLVTAFTCFSTFGLSQAQPAQDQLKAGFQHPPTSARPRVWWHWMNGNIAKEGIKLDLEWMHRVGIDLLRESSVILQRRLAHFKTSEYASSLTGPHRTYRNFMQMLSL